ETSEAVAMALQVVDHLVADRHQVSGTHPDAGQHLGDDPGAQTGVQQQADALDRVHVRLPVPPIAARVALRPQQTLLLVVAQQPLMDSGAPQQLPYPHAFPLRPGHLLTLTLMSEISVGSARHYGFWGRFMTLAADHYDQLLAQHYTWMLGGDLSAV